MAWHMAVRQRIGGTKHGGTKHGVTLGSSAVLIQAKWAELGCFTLFHPGMSMISSYLHPATACKTNSAFLNIYMYYAYMYPQKIKQ